MQPCALERIPVARVKTMSIVKNLFIKGAFFIKREESNEILPFLILINLR